MLQPLELYRSLLRQCTYLPDPQSRTFFSQLIKTRARKSKRITSLSPTLQAQRTRKLLKDGKRTLSLLSNASHGHLAAFEKVLNFTYGRTGPRRRILLAELIASNASPVPQLDRSTLLRIANYRREQRLASSSEQFALSGQLRALALSMQSRPGFHAKIRHLAPKIPATNSWDKPMPACRIPKFLRDFRASTYKKLLPPLPDDEIRRLEDLATGAIAWVGRPQPRPSRIAGKQSTSSAEEESDRSVEGNQLYWEAAQQDARNLTLQSNKRMRPHDITSRFIRRAWMRVLEQIPILYQDENNDQQWLVKWYTRKRGWLTVADKSGHGPRKPVFKSAAVAAAASSKAAGLVEFVEPDRAFFEGVIATGQSQRK